ncbi:MAG: hypothetical protein C0448_11670 [Sphingobacteriaceae bacterium]|nr:hypothetical protein [Sphingobacteriaceae bacterium]
MTKILLLILLTFISYYTFPQRQIENDSTTSIKEIGKSCKSDCDNKLQITRSNPNLVDKADHCSYKKTSDNKSDSNTFWSDILKNFVTIILALIAGILALYQMKANIISSARIRWIEDLRDTLSKLYPATLDILNSFENHKLHSKLNNPEKANESYLEYTKNMTTFNALSNKVRMQLNSNEPDHKAIENILDEIDTKIHQHNIFKITGEELEVYLKKIVVHSKVIFKEEWEKSKKIFKI